MEKFKGKRKLEDVGENAKKNGYRIDTTDFHKKGSDYIYLTNKDRRIAYNTFNGSFMIYDSKGKCIANHKSEELDNEDWYQEILDMFYVPS
ncbi:hypothetical protein [Halocella sp. SP3-1]|uniref:hypothetical protein n=1 Tax=Halocella sp. SP3-1 TaxID=2382161 RepID=UPI000F765C8A|nr:hypothetical protein [Halocella sp. SP3-1]AZO95258.1 hypothetical protein D7D81_12025 [Halocella sp. SP3-1]